MSRNIARFFHFSLEIEFNALRFINYTVPRLCSAYAGATLIIKLKIETRYVERCGGKPHKKNECPAKESFCNSCKRNGNWTKMLQNKKCVKNTGNQNDKEFFFGEIRIVQLDSLIKVHGKLLFKLPASVYGSLKPSVKLEPTNKV